MSKAKRKDGYGVPIPTRGEEFPAPQLPYRPQQPRSYSPGVGLIGCGGIAGDHLKAYRAAGFRVVALCDVDERRAAERRDEFYPQAAVYADYRSLLQRDDVEVVDIATHPPERPPLVEAALLAGKHVLSQKPFVNDVAEGRRLAQIAQEAKRLLAVNQNGRWAPHFSYMREVVQAGLLGPVGSVHCRVHWNHAWVEGTEFEKVRHLVLYDFGIHWFDFLRTIAGDREPRRVFASFCRSPWQTVSPNLLGQALVQFDDMQASLIFDGDVQFGAWDATYIAGERGTLHAEGVDLKQQKVTLYAERGWARPTLEGRWFPDAFAGTMGELLCAIEEERPPSHSAENNLLSLQLCFAAVASAERGEAVEVGSVDRLIA